MTSKTQPIPAAASKAPTFILWFIPEREGAPWMRIGALWPTKSGKGYLLKQELVPVAKGAMVIMPNEPREAAEEKGA